MFEEGFERLIQFHEGMLETLRIDLVQPRHFFLQRREHLHSIERGKTLLFIILVLSIVLVPDLEEVIPHEAARPKVLFQKDFLVFIWIESHFEGLDHHLTYTILLALINLSQFISSLKVGAFLLMRCKGASARLKIATQSERVWGILVTSESDLKRLSDDIPGFPAKG
jgi:hypothetical protein